MWEVLAFVLKYLIQGTICILNVGTQNSDELNLGQVGEKKKHFLEQINIFLGSLKIFLDQGITLFLHVDRLNIVNKNTVLHTTNNTLCGKISQEMTVCWTWIPSQIIKGLESKGQEELKGETLGTRGWGSIRQ